MNGAVFTGGTATLFNRTGEHGFRASLLRGVRLSVSDGITGGDGMPSRSATLYFFDTRSSCTDVSGRALSYMPPSEWAALSDRSGSFTFDASGGDWLAEGDLTALAEPPYGSAFRIVGAERMTGGRRHLWHFIIRGV